MCLAKIIGLRFDKVWISLSGSEINYQWKIKEVLQIGLSLNVVKTWLYQLDAIYRTATWQ